MTMSGLHASQSKSVRFHVVEWDETTQRAGFTHLNEQLREHPAYQFQVAKNGPRVIGIPLGNVFYICWIDWDHQLYPKG